MNKTLSLLFIAGLATLFCTSCSKVEQIFPESFERNDKPFSVEKVPVEGGTITLQRVNGDEAVILNPESTSLTFDIGDTLILTATPKNGYTFINWVRDGKLVSTDPSYQFYLEGKDMKDGQQVKYHYEARFGLDYALQVIPSIDQVIPADLIAEMGPYLHFGDAPPRIDTCFYLKDSIQVARFIHNQDIDPTSSFSFLEGQWIHYRQHNFKWHGQHRCVADRYHYTRLVGDSIQFLPNVYYRIFENASVTDSIFVMGEGDKFTAYFHQEVKRAMEPDEQFSSFIRDYDLVRKESVILSGRITSGGVADFHYGVRIEGYNKYSASIGVEGGSPNVHDIIIYDYPTVCPFEYPYYQDNN